MLGAATAASPYGMLFKTLSASVYGIDAYPRGSRGGCRFRGHEPVQYNGLAVNDGRERIKAALKELRL